MDKGSIESLRDFEIGKHNVESHNPGAIEESKEKDWAERLDLMWEKIKGFLLVPVGDVQGARTPDLTIIPADGDKPAVVLRLSAAVIPTGTRSSLSIEAFWRYATPPPQQADKDCPDLNLWYESFTSAWITAENDGRADLNTDLNRLEHSVAEYERALANLTYDQAVELGLRPTPEQNTQHSIDTYRAAARQELDIHVFTTPGGELRTEAQTDHGKPLTDYEMLCGLEGFGRGDGHVITPTYDGVMSVEACAELADALEAKLSEPSTE